MHCSMYLRSPLKELASSSFSFEDSKKAQILTSSYSCKPPSPKPHLHTSDLPDKQLKACVLTSELPSQEMQDSSSTETPSKMLQSLVSSGKFQIDNEESKNSTLPFELPSKGIQNSFSETSSKDSCNSVHAENSSHENGVLLLETSDKNTNPLSLETFSQEQCDSLPTKKLSDKLPKENCNSLSTENLSQENFDIHPTATTKENCNNFTEEILSQKPCNSISTNTSSQKNCRNSFREEISSRENYVPLSSKTLSQEHCSSISAMNLSQKNYLHSKTSFKENCISFSTQTSPTQFPKESSNSDTVETSAQENGLSLPTKILAQGDSNSLLSETSSQENSVSSPIDRPKEKLYSSFTSQCSTPLLPESTSVPMCPNTFTSSDSLPQSPQTLHSSKLFLVKKDKNSSISWSIQDKSTNTLSNSRPSGSIPPFPSYISLLENESCRSAAFNSKKDNIAISKKKGTVEAKQNNTNSCVSEKNSEAILKTYPSPLPNKRQTKRRRRFEIEGAESSLKMELNETSLDLLPPCSNTPSSLVLPPCSNITSLSSPNAASTKEVKRRRRLSKDPIDEAEKYAVFLPLKDGWVREIVYRAMTTKRQSDIYYHPPTGRKLRSMVEVEKYLVENSSNFTLENFSYRHSPYGYGPPFEIVRDANKVLPFPKAAKKEYSPGKEKNPSNMISPKKEKHFSLRQGISLKKEQTTSLRKGNSLVIKKNTNLPKKSSLKKEVATNLQKEISLQNEQTMNSKKGNYLGSSSKEAPTPNLRKGSSLGSSQKGKASNTQTTGKKIIIINPLKKGPVNFVSTKNKRTSNLVKKKGLRPLTQNDHQQRKSSRVQKLRFLDLDIFDWLDFGDDEDDNSCPSQSVGSSFTRKKQEQASSKPETSPQKPWYLKQEPSTSWTSPTLSPSLAQEDDPSLSSVRAPVMVHEDVAASLPSHDLYPTQSLKEEDFKCDEISTLDDGDPLIQFVVNDNPNEEERPLFKRSSYPYRGAKKRFKDSDWQAQTSELTDSDSLLDNQVKPSDKINQGVTEERNRITESEIRQVSSRSQNARKEPSNSLIRVRPLSELLKSPEKRFPISCTKESTSLSVTSICSADASQGLPTSYSSNVISKNTNGGACLLKPLQSQSRNPEAVPDQSCERISFFRPIRIKPKSKELMHLDSVSSNIPQNHRSNLPFKETLMPVANSLNQTSKETPDRPCGMQPIPKSNPISSIGTSLNPKNINCNLPSKVVSTSFSNSSGSSVLLTSPAPPVGISNMSTVQPSLDAISAIPIRDAVPFQLPTISNFPFLRSATLISNQNSYPPVMPLLRPHIIPNKNKSAMPILRPPAPIFPNHNLSVMPILRPVISKQKSVSKFPENFIPVTTTNSLLNPFSNDFAGSAFFPNTIATLSTPSNAPYTADISLPSSNSLLPSPINESYNLLPEIISKKMPDTLKVFNINCDGIPGFENLSKKSFATLVETFNNGPGKLWALRITKNGKYIYIPASGQVYYNEVGREINNIVLTGLTLNDPSNISLLMQSDYESTKEKTKKPSEENIPSIYFR